MRNIRKLLILLVLVLFSSTVDMKANDEDHGSILPENSIELTENGDVKYTNDSDSENKVISKRSSFIENGVVNFGKTKGNIAFTEEQTGKSGYVNSNSGADGAYLGQIGNKVRFKLSGVVGVVDANVVQVVDYSDVYSVNFYRVDNGRIRHYITTNLASSEYSYPIDIGPKQLYMRDNVVYYSYDAHYFYTEYEVMLRDYEKNVYTNSINPNTPYYNYFQYLPHRSKTNFTSVQLNEKINDIVGEANSVMKNQGKYFVEYQNVYGANASLMFGVAANESNWGRSSIALSKKNLFGHKAYDVNPDENAEGYKNPSDSILAHAKIYISKGYSNPHDWRYFGAELGDKLTGINVKYASDPYWGEKAAAQSHYLESLYGNKNIDYGNYTIGIKMNFKDKKVYNQASSNSTVLFSTGTTNDYPFIILNKVHGEFVDGNDVWYKIQSDASLNSSRTKVEVNDGLYNWNQSYAFIHSSDINIVNYGNNQGVKSIKINPTSATISKGKVFKATAYITPSNAVNSKITWRSGNNKILSVDQNGNVKAVGVGRTYVYAKSDNGVEGRSLITVVQGPESIALNPSILTMSLGTSYTLKILMTPLNASTSLTWTTGNATILNVDNGKIKALHEGKTYVYCITTNGLKTKTLVSVLPDPMSITINPTYAKLSVGKKYQARAYVKPLNSGNSAITWESSNPLVASVDMNGNVEARAVGETQIIAKTKNGKFVSSSITVVEKVN